MDHDGNTPLHLIVNYHKAISDFPTLHSIITDLTENGAHTDCVNKRGETPLEAAATGSKCLYIFSHELGLIEEMKQIKVAFFWGLLNQCDASTANQQLRQML